MKKHKILDKRRLMKNTTSVMSIFVAFLLIFNSAVSVTTSSDNTMNMNDEKIKPNQQVIADVSPNIDSIIPSVELDPSQLSQPGNNLQTMDLWDLIFDFDVEEASGAAGNAGAHFTDDEFYSTRWASNLQHQYDRDGNLLKQYTVSGVTNVRDLAYDGDYLYGGAASSTIWGWDPISEILEVTITGSFLSRALAYNSEDDTFFCSDWGDPVWEVNRDGDIVDSFDLALTTSTYGFAYDKWSDGGPYMWVYDQGGTGAIIYQWELASGEFTGIEHDTTDDFGDVIAGGLFITEDYGVGELLLGGLGQDNGAPDTMFVYDIDVPWGNPHDVGIKSINYPVSGTAIEEIPMQATAKNWGNNTEVTDVQMNIVRFEGTDDFFIDENFSGTFPPDGWTTDWWNQSNTNYASALAPEAHCYYYDQIVYYDYYDNYVQGPIVNATGWEKVNLRFAFSADVQSSCYLYLRYRKNSTSPWLDITPWDVPIVSDFTDWFEIGFYSNGEDIGNEFQFKFEYLGYYSYFRNWYLDNVTLEGCDGCDEYSEIVEDVTIPVGEPVDVDFPAWTPTNWQNESTVNMWFDYHVQARTLLDDQVKKNDQKWKLVDIYFPWMDDVAAINLEGPESGPAQTFDVVGTIKNVGQNEQCCFKTYVEIAEIDYSNSSVLWTEDFELGSGNTPPPGWDIGDSSSNAWSWSSYSSYLPSPYGSGKSTRCYWSYSNGAELISPVIDTSSAGYLEANWGMYYEHFTGVYELYVDIRPNPDEPWTEIQPWDNPVNGNMGPDWYTADATIGIGTETQLRFRTGGYYYNMDYWFFDNLEITGYGVKEPEFEDELCITEIDPGEEVELNFDDWTPEYLIEETSGTKKYIVKCWSELEDPEDENPDNDLFNKIVELDFFHDVGIQDITSPTEVKGEEIIFSQVPIASGGHSSFSDAGTAYRCYENFWDLYAKIGAVHWWGLCGYGSGVPQAGMTFQVAFCEDNGGVPDYTNHIYEQDGTLGTDITFEGTGVFYFGYELFYFTMALEENVDLEEGWVSFYKTSITSEVFAMIDAETGSGDNMAYQAGVGTIFYDLAFELVKGGLSVDVYIPLGSQNIDAIVENIGTFPELDLVCYAEIYEFITNCTVGTLVYEDNTTNIDLDEPLGGNETLNFDNYNFAIEGAYGLFLNLPDDDDDYTKNNEFVLGIGADDTPPNSTYYLDPPEPDGDNGWYVSDVEVTICATDPEIGCGHPGSGVKGFYIKIGSGSWQFFPGDCITFIIDPDDDNLLIEYYAIDNVGNEEAHNSFQIDMDQTVPDIEEVEWWIFKYKPIYGPWYVTFTCDATDATSGMDRVEMYINEGFCQEIVGAGPIYEFTIEWSSILKTVVFTFEHYDRAGNMIENYIDGDNIVAYPYIHNQQQKPVSRPTKTHQNSN